MPQEKWVVLPKSWNKFSTKYAKAKQYAKQKYKLSELKAVTAIPICVGSLEEPLPESLEALANELKAKGCEYTFYLYPQSLDSLKAWFEKNKNWLSKSQVSNDKIVFCFHDEALAEKADKFYERVYLNWTKSPAYLYAKSKIDKILTDEALAPLLNAALEKDIKAYQKKHTGSSEEDSQAHALHSAIGDLSTMCSENSQEKFFTASMYQHKLSNTMNWVHYNASAMGYIFNFYGHIQFETKIQAIEEGLTDTKPYQPSHIAQVSQGITSAMLDKGRSLQEMVSVLAGFCTELQQQAQKQFGNSPNLENAQSHFTKTTSNYGSTLSPTIFSGSSSRSRDVSPNQRAPHIDSNSQDRDSGTEEYPLTLNYRN